MIQVPKYSQVKSKRDLNLIGHSASCSSCSLHFGVQSSRDDREAARRPVKVGSGSDVTILTDKSQSQLELPVYYQ